MILVDAINFQQIYNEISTLKLPIKVSYGLSKIMNGLKDDIDFFNSRLQEIVTDYSDKDENGNPILTDDGRGIVVSDEKKEECNQKIQELYTTEITPPATNLTIGDLENVSNLELTVQQIEILAKFLGE